MEELIYIVLVVIWLLVSFLRRKPKKDRPEGKPKPVPQEQTAPPDDEASVEEVLEEFFGGGKKKEEKQPKKEPVYEAAERKERRDTYGHEGRREREWSERQQADKEQSWDEGQDTKGGVFEGVEGQTGVSEDFEFVSEGKKLTIEEMIQSYKEDEAKRLAMEEEDADYQPSEGIPEFDLRTAVIFSEILNRKYQ